MKNSPDQELERWDNTTVTEFPEGIDPVWDAADFGVVEKFVGGFKGLKILDVGCGVGNASIYFLKRGAFVTGLDLGPKNIEIARSRAASLGISSERYHFTARNVFELDNLSLGVHDLVFCSFFLHHFFGDEVARLAEKLSSAIKPNGRIVMYENSNRNFLLMGCRRLIRALGRSEGVENEYPLDQQRIEAFSKSSARRPTILFGNCSFLKLFAYYLRTPFIMPLCTWGDRMLHRSGASYFISYRQMLVFQQSFVEE